MGLPDKEYQPDNTSPEEAEALRSSFRELEPGILLYEELPRPTVYSIGLVAEGLRRLAKVKGAFALLVDLSRPGPPSAPVRKALRNEFFDAPGLSYVGVFTGRNAAVNVVVRIVMSQTISVDFSVSRTAEEALAAARKALASLRAAEA